MTTKMNSEMAASKSYEDDESFAPSLKRFVQSVNKALINQAKSPINPSELIKNAENLEKKFPGASNHVFGTKSSPESDTLLLDPILHHRVMLATGIAKSFSSGTGLSNQRRKILQSNIEYIENRL